MGNVIDSNASSSEPRTLPDAARIQRSPGKLRLVRPVPARPAAWMVLALMAAGALLFWWLHRHDLHEWWLEDLPIYVRAVRTWMNGQSPYDASLRPLFFLYPPFFLFLAWLFSHMVPAGAGPVVYVASAIVATLAIPLVLAKSFFRVPWMGPLLALFLFFASPRFTGTLALCGVNVASILYCAAFLGAVPGLSRNRWGWFYLAVFFAAMVKIPYLALLLIPVLAARRQWLASAGCTIAVAVGYLVEKRFWPGLYAGYQWSLKQGILLSQQFGYGPFGVVASYHHKQRVGAGIAAYVIAGSFAVVLLAAMFRMRQRRRAISLLAGNKLSSRELSGNGVWLAMILVSMILINPRILQYDMDIALLASFVLWVYGFRVKRLLVLAVALFLPSLLVPYLILNPHLHGAYETGVVLVGLIRAYIRMDQETGISPPAATAAA